MPDTLLAGDLALLLIRITAVLTLSLLWAAALVRASASTRYLVWLTSLSLLLLVPLLSRVVPSLGVLPVLVETSAPVQQPLDRSAESSRAATEPSAMLSTAAGSTAVAPDAGPGREWPSRETVVAFLLALWAVGSLLLLGRLALSSLALRRALRSTSPLTGSGWATPLYEAADRLDLSEIPRLVSSSHAPMPFACGFREPTIVLPARAEQWDADRRRAVLFHELAHIRRRDLVGHAVARVVCALYWVHPLVWTAARRLRAESERACDDLALSVGIKPSEYADHLLQIVTAVRRSSSPLVALPFAERRELEGRVLAILDPVLPRGRPRRVHAGAVAALLLFGVGFSALAPAAGPGSSLSSTDRSLAETVRALTDGSAAPAVTQDPGGEALTSSLRSAASALGPEALDALERQIELAMQTPLEAALDLELDRTAATAVEERLKTGKKDDDGEIADLPTVLRVLQSDPSADVRRAAAWTLARVDTISALIALQRALLRDQDESVREMAAWALESSGRGADGLVEALSRDASERVRATAAWSLASSEIERETALSALGRALRDRSSRVRERAAWAIGTLEPPSAPRELYEIGLADPEIRVRRAAAWALAEIADERAAPAALERIDSEPDEEARRSLFRALLLTEGASPEVAALLLRSPDPEMRSRGVEIAAGKRTRGWPAPWPWPDPRPNP